MRETANLQHRVRDNMLELARAIIRIREKCYPNGHVFKRGDPRSMDKVPPP